VRENLADCVDLVKFEEYSTDGESHIAHSSPALVAVRYSQVLGFLDQELQAEKSERDCANLKIWRKRLISHSSSERCHSSHTITWESERAIRN
jgi:hypothetical protein